MGVAKTEYIPDSSKGMYPSLVLNELSIDIGCIEGGVVSV